MCGWCLSHDSMSSSGKSLLTWLVAPRFSGSLTRMCLSVSVANVSWCLHGVVSSAVSLLIQVAGSASLLYRQSKLVGPGRHRIDRSVRLHSFRSLGSQQICWKFILVLQLASAWSSLASMVACFWDGLSLSSFGSLFRLCFQKYLLSQKKSLHPLVGRSCPCPSRCWDGQAITRSTQGRQL